VRDVCIAWILRTVCEERKEGLGSRSFRSGIDGLMEGRWLSNFADQHGLLAFMGAPAGIMGTWWVAWHRVNFDGPTSRDEEAKEAIFGRAIFAIYRFHDLLISHFFSPKSDSSR